MKMSYPADIWPLMKMSYPADIWPLMKMSYPADSWSLMKMSYPADSWSLMKMSYPADIWPLMKMSYPADSWPLMKMSYPADIWPLMKIDVDTATVELKSAVCKKITNVSVTLPSADLCAVRNSVVCIDYFVLAYVLLLKHNSLDSIRNHGKHTINCFRVEFS